LDTVRWLGFSFEESCIIFNLFNLFLRNAHFVRISSEVQALEKVITGIWLFAN
jgi:hypothetical protein